MRNFYQGLAKISRSGAESMTRNREASARIGDQLVFFPLNRCYTSDHILTGLKERCECCDLMMMSYLVMQIVGKSYFEVWLHSSWSDVLLSTCHIVLFRWFLSHTFQWLECLLLSRVALFYLLCSEWDTTCLVSSSQFPRWKELELHGSSILSHNLAPLLLFPAMNDYKQPYAVFMG